MCGHGERFRRGDAEVLARLCDHGREWAGVVFVTCGFAGHQNAFLGVGHGLGVVGVAVLVAQFHPARFGFDGVVMLALIGGQWGQAFWDCFAQGLALGLQFELTLTGIINRGKGILNIVEFGMNPQLALEQPTAITSNFHASNYPQPVGDQLTMPEVLAGRIGEALRAKGHKLEVTRMQRPYAQQPAGAGAVKMVWIDPRSGVMFGAVSPAKDDYAMGW